MSWLKLVQFAEKCAGGRVLQFWDALGINLESQRNGVGNECEFICFKYILA